MSARILKTLVTLTVLLGGTVLTADDRIDLSGAWSFRLDREDKGLGRGWAGWNLPGDQTITLPGSLQEQGFGDAVTADTKWTGSIIDRSFFDSPRYAPYREPGNVKYPCWLQPERVYTGVAWYQRTVDVPVDWRDAKVILSLERPHWETRVWIDRRHVGSRNSLSTPHVYDLGQLEPGRHRLTIRVDNRMIVNVGPNSHSVSDHTQGNWNGIVGEITLSARPAVRIDDLQIFPDVSHRAARVRLRLGNDSGFTAKGRLTLAAQVTHGKEPYKAPDDQQVDVTVATTGEEVEVYFPLGRKAPLWDEFDPTLFIVTAWLETHAGGTAYTHTAHATFGLREFSVPGTRFALNGRPFFVRGTLDCCIYPLTGYPPCDEDHWRKVIRAAQAHGLNHIRFHSWCPPEAAFAVADELGFTFQVECASWANQGSGVGDGKPIDRWLYEEAARILKAYGNHPSFVMMAYGNEPAGANQKEWLGRWVDHWKSLDPRRLYTSAAGWPELPQNEFHNIPGPRIQGWGQGLGSRINGRPPETRTDYSSWVRDRSVPIVSHEIGQWCVYPNFDEIGKYTGLLKPKNLEIFRDFLNAGHMGDQARAFLMASGRLQTLCYKEEIEAALRTPGFGGFQLLDLHDFPGQGTALVGVLDPFWEPKGYVTAEEFRRFCNSTVPLARFGRRIWKSSDHFRADLEIAHFGPEPIENAVTIWSLRDAGGRTVASGRLPARTIPVGNGRSLGEVAVPLKNATPAAKHTLVVGIERTDFENDWDLWVFADTVDTAPPEDVSIAASLDEESMERLASGGKVLLLPPSASVDSNVAIGFSPVFWNTAWTRVQPPHTLGLLCDPAHPAFAAFPAEGWSNWHWWELVTGSAAMILDGLPPELRPLVQPIDTWFEARRLGLLLEARVGGGRLMICSMDLERDLDERLVARQLRRSLFDYMASAAFDPTIELTPEQVAGLFRKTSYLVIEADSEAVGHEAANAVDGDPATIWHTPWGSSATPMPHSIVIDLGEVLPVRGVVYTPRQEMANGRIARFEIRAGNDRADWGEPLASGTWPNSRARQTVAFERSVQARYLKLTARSEVNGNAFAAVAELSVLTE